MNSLSAAPMGSVAEVTLDGTRPGVTAVSRNMYRHRLGRRREQNRRIDEIAAPKILDVGVTENIVPWRRGKLSAIHPGLAAIVGVHHAGNRDWIKAKTARVVVPNDDVLPRAVNGDRGLGLATGRAVLIGVAIVLACSRNCQRRPLSSPPRALAARPSSAPLGLS